MEARGGFETARFAFVAPTADVPINVPITVRTGSDYGLRMTVTGITQEIPFAGADITVWGFPADAEHDIDRFHVGERGCAGIAATSCIVPPYVTAGIPVKPYVDNPTICTGQPLTARLQVTSYEDPTAPRARRRSYSADDPLRETGLQPRPQPGSHQHRVRCAVRARSAVPGSDLPRAVEFALRAPIGDRDACPKG